MVKSHQKCSCCERIKEVWVLRTLMDGVSWVQGTEALGKD